MEHVLRYIALEYIYILFIYLFIYYGPGYLSQYSDWLRAGRSGDRVPGGEIFCTRPDRHWNPPNLLSSYAMGTGYFLRVKWPQRGVDHPPPASAEVKERVQLCLYSPSGPSCTGVGWNFYLFIYFWRTCRGNHLFNLRPRTLNWNLQTNRNESLFFYQLDAQILYFNTFITFLYMFRALLCSSSGGQLC